MTITITITITKMKTDLISPFDDNNSSKEDDDRDETNPGPIPGATNQSTMI